MDDEGRHNHEFRFNAILVGLLGIIAGAIMVATYHLIHSLCGSCRRQTVETANISQNVHQNQQERPSERSRSRSNSITPRLISIFRYSKDCNEEMCAVCLADFKEGERIRVLPDCLHFFHVPCIDKWLNLHSNCPLCRADASTSPQDSSRTPPLGLNRLPDFGV